MSAIPRSTLAVMAFSSAFFVSIFVYYTQASAAPFKPLATAEQARSGNGCTTKKGEIPNRKSFPFKAPEITGALPPRREVPLKELKSRLTDADLTAALQAMSVVLSEIGDGTTYVWGRPMRRLRGLITPLSSFRNAEGQICRHVGLYSHISALHETHRRHSLPHGRRQMDAHGIRVYR